MTWERYQGLVVSEERIKRGRALLAENRAAIERFAGPAGLPPQVAGMLQPYIQPMILASPTPPRACSPATAAR
jgi:hypothetical protein